MSGAAIHFALQLLLALFAPVAIYLPFALTLRGRMVYWNLAIPAVALFSDLQDYFLTPLIVSAITVNLLHFLIHYLIDRDQRRLPGPK